MNISDPPPLAARWLADRLPSRRAGDIALRVAELIRAGELHAGARLPTVREMADAGAVSVGTIAQAWSRLRAQGLIATHRRGGTRVQGVAPTAAPAPAPAPGPARPVDLSHATPDPALQPPLQAALLSGLQSRDLHAPSRESITARLRGVIAPGWPFAAEAWSTAGGGVEGELLALAVAGPPGTLIALEEPTSPRVLEAVARLGLRTVGVACDADGPRPDALRRVLRQHTPAAFVFQPRAQMPMGFTLADARAQVLAGVLSRHGGDVAVIENDMAGPVAALAPASLGRWLPSRVLHVRAYCKTYGVDLRTCVVGGAAALVERFERQRSFGRAATSRILQDALAHLESDRATQRAVDRARAVYARRRQALQDALAARGLPLPQRDGFVLWLPVHDEAEAALRLASAGIHPGLGRRCHVAPGAPGRLRIATTRLDDDPRRIGVLADRLVAAARPRGAGGGEDFA